MTMTKEDSCLVMFVRFPGRGQVKSRLAKELGEEAATNLYRFFVEDLLARFSRGTYGLRVAFHPADKGRKMREMLGDEFSYIPQEGENLGGRMKHSFLRCFSEGARRVVLIGSDIPDLPGQIIDEAFLALDGSDAVIGPAADGGYYLLGFKREAFNADVFPGIPWGTAAVFRKTMEIFDRAGTLVHVLPVWRDIDRPEDIRALIEDSRKTGFANSKTMAYLKAIGLA